jgi:lipopolysaccharide export system permease protein
MLFYASFALLPYAFPLAMLLASIMTFGSLGENYDW